MRISIWLMFLQQTLCSLSLLLALGLAAQLPRKAPWRLVGTAIGGGAATLLAMGIPSLPGRLAVAFPLMALAPLLAWPGIPRRLIGQMAGLNAVLSLLMMGMMRLISPLPLFALPLSCCLIAALPRLIPRPAELPQCTTVEIRQGASKLTLTGLIDSGNLLRDVITGLPVVMISRRAAERLMPVDPKGGLSPGQRLMPVRTVSGTALMIIFRPDSVSLLLDGTWQPVRTLIGLSPEGYDGFQALVPATLLSAPSLPDHAISQGG